MSTVEIVSNATALPIDRGSECTVPNLMTEIPVMAFYLFKERQAAASAVPRASPFNMDAQWGTGALSLLRRTQSMCDLQGTASL